MDAKSLVTKALQAKSSDINRKHTQLLENFLQGTLSLRDATLAKSIALKINSGSYVNPLRTASTSYPGLSMQTELRGYVYFEGIPVEHYTYPSIAETDAALAALYDRCESLLENGLVLSGRSAVSLVDTPKQLMVSGVSFYAFFMKENHMAGVFYPEVDGMVVVTSEQSPLGSPYTVTHHSQLGAYETYHHLIAQGWESAGVVLSDKQLMGFMSKLLISEEELAGHLNKEYLLP